MYSVNTVILCSSGREVLLCASTSPVVLDTLKISETASNVSTDGPDRAGVCV